MDEITHLKQLIALMNENDLAEIELVHENGRKIRLRKAIDESPRMVAVMPGMAPAAPARPEGSVSAAAAPSGPTPLAANVREITSPMVGTFYRSPSPDADAYVDVGDGVNEESVVCIIEAMKVMNEIKAEVEGEVVEVLVESGEPVEYGQPLFRVRLSGG